MNQASTPFHFIGCTALIENLGRRAQDERWRLLSQGIRSWSDGRFGPAVLSEQWAIARLEVIDGAHPIRAILAQRRMRAIASCRADASSAATASA